MKFKFLMDYRKIKSQEINNYNKVIILELEMFIKSN